MVDDVRTWHFGGSELWSTAVGVLASFGHHDHESKATRSGRLHDARPKVDVCGTGHLKQPEIITKTLKNTYNRAYLSLF